MRIVEPAPGAFQLLEVSLWRMRLTCSVSLRSSAAIIASIDLTHVGRDQLGLRKRLLGKGPDGLLDRLARFVRLA